MEESACIVVKNIGKPDAGKLHVRFDEGGQGETRSLLYPQGSRPPPRGSRGECGCVAE